MPDFSGEFRVPASREAVFEFLVDPECLIACLPDVRRYEIQDATHFVVTLQVGLSRLRGLVSMKMEIAETNLPCGARIVGRGSMLNSHISVEGTMDLSDLGSETVVRWSAQAKAGAYLMQLAGGIMDRLVREHVGRFVQAVAQAISREVKSEGALDQPA